MGLFTKRSLTSDEYADLSARIVKINTDVAIMKGDFERIETRFKSLHTKVARVKADEEEDDNAPTQDLASMQRRLLGMPD